MITHDQKKQIIQKYGTHKNDSGSPQVQVAILTERIDYLKKHLESHKHDNHSRRGLLMMVGARRKHLNYLKSYNGAEYEKIIKALKLRK
jgi:small subunit ribosomal protein S15